MLLLGALTYLAGADGGAAYGSDEPCSDSE